MDTNKIKVEEMVIDGTTYVPKDSIQEKAESTDGMPIVLVRTYSAGIHYGSLKSKRDSNGFFAVELLNSRRVWSWYGASECNQLATDGTSKPEKCKMPCTVNSVELMAIEIIPMTEKAVNSLNSVAIWKE